MSLKTAIRNSPILTFVVLGVFAWLLFTMLDVIRDTAWLELFATDYVGQNAAGGAIGVLVLVILLGSIVMLYSEISEEEPSPESWPPSE